MSCTGETVSKILTSTSNCNIMHSKILDAQTLCTISTETLFLYNNFSFLFHFTHGPGSSVSIATSYGLDGPGIESRWGYDFLHTPRPALGPTQPPVQWVLGLSQG
jgi:hypothetical protein